MLIRTPPTWGIPDRRATPEGVCQNRRQLVRTLGLGIAGGILAPTLGAAAKKSGPRVRAVPTADLYPARRNERFMLDQALIPASVASRHNIFDEFTLDRRQVWKVASGFASRPWTIHVGGAVEKELCLDVDVLIRRMGIEERLYRFRCVEAWAMAVPWSGFPFKRFLDLARPLASARYVRMVTAARPEAMPGWYASKRVFPYYEALSLAEASNDSPFSRPGSTDTPCPTSTGRPCA